MDNESCGQGNCQSKRKSPDIEGKIRILEQPSVNFREKISDQPRRQTRHDEQREHLRYNHTESCPEINIRHRMHQWNNQRNKHSCQKIDKDYICRDARHVTAKFSGNNGSSSSSRADQAQHRTFHQHHPVVA